MRDWTLIATNRHFGDKAMISQNFDETYIVTPQGTWVPTSDVPWLTSIKLRCPACDHDRVQVFGIINATAKQMSAMPKRSPKMKSRTGLGEK